ncbi:hypothetical protein MPTK1_7g00870 [Marchantia polymorpha subsp. ruderalis]|uniref:Uncharacterized protein n=2 Tax=Marchantia polymorpha TaxID=3197 RepID=A0AAF6BUV7_MARPO|nr:hypothetical protein MARPO_0046s0037 [Marchantia polymorpha]BBN15791.1 hypothetical protein Mp_7g00870 [Marchantia polymorpha subsp. ruderalis]|eukprot:PTQ39215.1 hypothetical protein MARPO_0046s0037 [Marchantia polymorpha]
MADSCDSYYVMSPCPYRAKSCNLRFISTSSHPCDSDQIIRISSYCEHTPYTLGTPLIPQPSTTKVRGELRHAHGLLPRSSSPRTTSIHLASHLFDRRKGFGKNSAPN